jgi:ABC-type uncharacterized transport system permease subunit
MWMVQQTSVNGSDGMTGLRSELAALTQVVSLQSQQLAMLTAGYQRLAEAAMHSQIAALTQQATSQSQQIAILTAQYQNIANASIQQVTPQAQWPVTCRTRRKLTKLEQPPPIFPGVSALAAAGGYEIPKSGTAKETGFLVGRDGNLFVDGDLRQWMHVVNLGQMGANCYGYVHEDDEYIVTGSYPACFFHPMRWR